MDTATAQLLGEPKRTVGFAWRKKMMMAIRRFPRPAAVRAEERADLEALRAIGAH